MGEGTSTTNDPAVSRVRLCPFFSYYGGKWRDALKYPPPDHETIIEPFAGSAGYALRHAGRKVILCDLDPIIVAVWRYLISAKPSDILEIGDIPDGGTVDDLNAPQEARWLAGFWVNKGTSAPCRRPSAWMRSGIRPGSFWGDKVRRRIAAQVNGIRHWQVHECEYHECPHPGPATWFVDPPYSVAGECYRYGSDGVDYEHLARWCRGLTGQVIVCENEGARWLPFEPLGRAKTSRRGRRSSEAVWTRGCIGVPQLRLWEQVKP